MPTPFSAIAGAWSVFLFLGGMGRGGDGAAASGAVAACAQRKWAAEVVAVAGGAEPADGELQIPTMSSHAAGTGTTTSPPPAPPPAAAPAAASSIPVAVDLRSGNASPVAVCNDLSVLFTVLYI